MTRATPISGTILVVGVGTALPGAEGAGLEVEQAGDAAAAIARIEGGEPVDAVLLTPGLEDPVRVAQRLHSLDRQGAVVVLTEPGGEDELRHALEVAPFLQGDVSMSAATGEAEIVAELAAAATRTRIRREEAAERKKRRETPPPLSASYLGTLLDSVPIGLVTLDAAGCVIGWNRRAGAMLDVPEVEALGTPLAELFEVDEQPRLAELIERLGSAGIEDDGQIFHRREQAFEVTGARFAIRTGDPGTLLILQDVTKREAAERELRIQKLLSDAQADTSMAGIVVRTLDGRLERVNRRFCEIWGVSAELMQEDVEAARREVLSLVEDTEAFTAGVERLDAGREFHDEVKLKDGRTIERYAAHAHDENGLVIGQIWFHTDITERKREEEALRFLADATNLLSSSLDYELTLQRVANLAVPRIADWCTVDIARGSGVQSVAIAHTDPEKVALARDFRRRYPDTGSGAVPATIRSGEPQVFAHLTDEQIAAMAKDDEHLQLLRKLELGSVMIVPIKVRDRVFGAINFIRSPERQSYGDDDLKLAMELARRAAIAIDNSRVHAELRDTARTLQESLLPPHLPAVRGLELATRFRPAGVGMDVGGDFYDIFETAADHWGVAVGDVCGKGAEAAALTALTRYTVRAAAMYETEAGGVLRVLNEALLRQRGDFRFTTLAFCIVDLVRKSVLAACGGHPRPLVLRADGRVEAIGAAGPLLGVVTDAHFPDDEVPLSDGDVLVLYTDGLTDALAPERQLHEEDLMQELARCRAQSAGEISRSLEDFALAGHAGQEPRDDIAIVVAKLG